MSENKDNVVHLHTQEEPKSEPSDISAKRKALLDGITMEGTFYKLAIKCNNQEGPIRISTGLTFRRVSYTARISGKDLDQDKWRLMWRFIEEYELTKEETTYVMWKFGIRKQFINMRLDKNGEDHELSIIGLFDAKTISSISYERVNFKSSVTILFSAEYPAFGKYGIVGIVWSSGLEDIEELVADGDASPYMEDDQIALLFKRGDSYSPFILQ